MQWISVDDQLPDSEFEPEVLAIFASKKGCAYSLVHLGWFRDIIYHCEIGKGAFIIARTGYVLPATHWMKLPQRPKD